MPLSKSQKRYLRGMAHGLKPVVMIGQRGLTESVLEELERALCDHELVKVRISNGDREARAADVEALTRASGAELVASIGHVAAVYRRNPDKPQIALPR